MKPSKKKLLAITAVLIASQTALGNVKAEAVNREEENAINEADRLKIEELILSLDERGALETDESGSVRLKKSLVEELNKADRLDVTLTAQSSICN